MGERDDEDVLHSMIRDGSTTNVEQEDDGSQYLNLTGDGIVQEDDVQQEEIARVESVSEVYDRVNTTSQFCTYQ